jgi:hypothetical protein
VNSLPTAARTAVSAVARDTPDLGRQALMRWIRKQNWPDLVILTRAFSVELPGIEPVPGAAL